MKFLTPKPGISDEEERRATDALTSALHERGYQGHPRLPDSLRNGMLVRTNERIDRLSSGRALSLSWAARVAVPGVVAIIAFFTALHYYGTPQPPRGNEVTPLLTGLADSQMDSLFEVAGLADSAAIVAAAGAGLFDVSSDGAADYLLEHDRSALVLESLSDAELDRVLAVLSTTPHSF
jgi:hypothetical protein